MADIILGIGDIYATNNQDTILKTYALGSCVAVLIYDNTSKTGGMVHIALSSSKLNIEKSREKPGYYADTAVDELLYLLRKYNPDLDIKKLDAYVIGGASIAAVEDFFKIGVNNIKVVKEKLKKLGIPIKKEDCGNNISRTVTFDIKNKKIIISNNEIGTWEL